ncbi:MAG TPA: hypothetical protein VMU01_13390 [Rhizomicrobium sp.]|nr:hypothetical protein [Rhizomicrobium sp.]
MGRTSIAIAAAVLFAGNAWAFCDTPTPARQDTIHEYLKVAALACQTGLVNGSLPRELRDPQSCVLTLAAYLLARNHAARGVDQPVPVHVACMERTTRTAAMTPLQVGLSRQ